MDEKKREELGSKVNENIMGGYKTVIDPITGKEVYAVYDTQPGSSGQIPVAVFSTEKAAIEYEEKYNNPKNHRPL